MSSTYQLRFYDQPQENDIKFNQTGKTKMLVVCLNYKGTSSPLTCIIDGQRIVAQAQKAGVSDIETLYDDNSTKLFPNKKNVSAKMKQMAQNCSLGDFFVVYYSGHGTSVDDIDKDQLDGKDEALCLMTESGKYDFMSDDEISTIISKSLPDNVPCLFIVDACHSGSILDLTNTKAWGSKKVYSISGCQDNQYSNDTGNGGQMTNILLAVIRENQHLRASKKCSLQYIFNRMILKNKEVEGNYKGIQKARAYEQLGSQSTIITILGLCCGVVKMCMGNQSTSGNFFEMAQGFVNFNDQPGEFTPINDQNKPGQWINLAWNGGSDPTRIPYPF